MSGIVTSRLRVRKSAVITDVDYAVFGGLASAQGLPTRCSGLWLSFKGVLVDLLQVEGLPYLNADVVPNHELGQLFAVDEP